MPSLCVWSHFSNDNSDTKAAQCSNCRVIWYYEDKWKSSCKEYENVEMLFPSAGSLQRKRESRGGQCFFLNMCLIEQGT